ncbi:MAG: alpha/beta fold hydrolase [Coriobacteriia bacterium]|nr:alpha/beta fold hydrolase [Coriobacteriia bacterium]
MQEFSFKSCDNKTTIHAVEWKATNKPKAVLQIAHGMAEHIMRYEDFAKFLNKHNIYVCGNDHIGHGKSVNNKNNLGYFAKTDGHKKVVDDMKKLTDITKEKHPKTPYFLLGHSMGSFMAREYCIRYGEELDGAIIMGTGQQPQALLAFVKTLCKLMAKSKGWNHRSNFIDKIAFGKYNKNFKPIKNGHEWLAKEESIQQLYIDDPLCGYTFTLNGFYNLFDVLSFVANKNNVSKVPKNLPILIVSGQNDPVGDYGKAPILVRDAYIDNGVKDVNMKLYENDRHEILNETDHDVVYKDILKWIEDRI